MVLREKAEKDVSFLDKKERMEKKQVHHSQTPPSHPSYGQGGEKLCPSTVEEKGGTEGGLPETRGLRGVPQKRLNPSALTKTKAYENAKQRNGSRGTAWGATSESSQKRRDERLESTERRGSVG